MNIFKKKEHEYDKDCTCDECMKEKDGITLESLKKDIDELEKRTFKKETRPLNEYLYGSYMWTSTYLWDDPVSLSEKVDAIMDYLKIDITRVKKNDVVAKKVKKARKKK